MSCEAVLCLSTDLDDVDTSPPGDCNDAFEVADIKPNDGHDGRKNSQWIDQSTNQTNK